MVNPTDKGTTNRENSVMNSRRCFCISNYSGSLDLLKYSKNDFCMYFKGEENRKLFDDFQDNRKILIPNTGYNLHAYFDFIVNNYESLPDIVVFCKDNIYPRHISEKLFAQLIRRNIYTPLVDPNLWAGIKFPTACRSSVCDYLEMNDNWYTAGRTGRYFDNFNDFFEFIFEKPPRPVYLRFGPGANAVIPREHILLRSRGFYENLLSFITYEPFALECFFIERAFDAIFCSPLVEREEMKKKLDKDKLSQMATRLRIPASRDIPWRWALTKIGYRISRYSQLLFGSTSI